MKRGQRPRRKVIVFLVDGFSEQKALSPTLSALYEMIDPSYEVFFPSMTEDGLEHYGDLTSKYGINPGTIEKCIEKLYFTDFLRKNKLYPKDISEIIHVLDMDGAYIDDSAIVYGENPIGKDSHGRDRPYYGKDSILTVNVDGIMERNKRKRENIDFLLSLEKIKIDSKSIPYSAYFFSSNLDHFLHGDANIPEGREKATQADEYAMKYVDDPEGFVKSLERLPGSLLNMSYVDSWAFIRERSNNSLDRHSNINVLFDKLMA